MRFCFWAALAVVLYTYAGYPLLMAVLARLRPHPWLRGTVAGDVSILMAVHNGEHMLPWKIDHLLALEPRRVKEVIFVSDGSTDGTADLLASIGHPRARVVILPDQVGKAAALNQGIAAATGEFVLFTDIRPRIEQDALEALLANFADPAIGCVAGELLVECGDQHAATTSAVGGLYWRYEQSIRNWEARFDSPVGVYGGFYAIRRSLASPYPAGLILDDMFQPLSIIRKGYRSVVDTSAIVVDTWPASTAGEFARKVRTLAGNFQLMQQAPWILGPGNRVLFQLVSHKLLRLAAPWMLMLLLLSSSLLSFRSPWWAAVTAAQYALWACALLSLRWRLPIIGKAASAAGALLVLNAAAVAGLYTFLFTSGPLWRIWSPTPTGAARHGFPLHKEQEHA